MKKENVVTFGYIVKICVGSTYVGVPLVCYSRLFPHIDPLLFVTKSGDSFLEPFLFFLVLLISKTFL